MIGHWTSCSIGDVLELQRGYDITRSQQTAGEVPVVSSGGIGSFHSMAMSDGPGVVIGRKGTLGKVFYLPGPYWPHDTTLWVRDFKGSDPKFVYYYFKTLDFDFLDVGSANPTLNRNHVHPLPTVWPPVGEQRAIVEVLGALDDKIAANDRLTAIADELARSLFRRGVSQETTALADVALVTMGTSPTGETLNERGGGMPFQQGVRDFGFRSPVDRVWTSTPIRLAEPGDTLLSVRAPVGRTNVADKHLCIGRGLAAVRSLRQAPWILFHSLTSVPEVWEPFEAGGTVFGSINKPQLNSLQIPLVTEGRERLESELAAMENQIATTGRESQRLAKVRDNLLPELMSGRMKVEDAESTVEGVL